MSDVRHLHVCLDVALIPDTGDLVALHGMPYVVVRTEGAFADLFPGHTLTGLCAVGRVQAHISLLTPLRHYVTVEPTVPGEPAHYVADWDVPPRLAIAEHRPGQPTVWHGTEGWVALGEMRTLARRVAARVGAEYVEPGDQLARELLGLAVAS